MPTYWLTINDTAKVLGVSAKTIRRMIQRGDLPAHRFGQRVIRINCHELAAAGQLVTPPIAEGVRS